MQYMCTCTAWRGTSHAELTPTSCILPPSSAFTASCLLAPCLQKLRLEAQTAPGGGQQLSYIQTHPPPQQLAFGQQPAVGGAVLLECRYTAGAVGGVSVGVGQSAMAPALQMTSGGGSTLESHPALVMLSPEVRCEDGKEGKEWRGEMRMGVRGGKERR